MNIDEALKPVDKDQLSHLSRRDLIDLLLCERDLRMRVIEKLNPNPKKAV
jgi:hypothetical protein